jgi:hypothetical protein
MRVLCPSHTLEMYGRLFGEYPGLDALLDETVCQREFMTYCCVREKSKRNADREQLFESPLNAPCSKCLFARMHTCLFT